MKILWFASLFRGSFLSNSFFLEGAFRGDIALWSFKLYSRFCTESPMKQNIRKMKSKWLKKLIAARQGGFIVPYVWEIVVWKNLTNFEGCHFAWFYILIWWSFPKMEIKNFNSYPFFFKFVKLGTISPAAHFINSVHIGRSQAIPAIICCLSSRKHFAKLREVF